MYLNRILLHSYFSKVAMFSLNSATPKTNYRNVYVKHCQPVMRKQKSCPHSSDNMLIITAPTLYVINECNAHMTNHKLLFGKVQQEHVERDLVHTEYKDTSTFLTEGRLLQ